MLWYICGMLSGSAIFIIHKGHQSPRLKGLESGGTLLQYSKTLPIRHLVLIMCLFQLRRMQEMLHKIQRQMKETH